MHGILMATGDEVVAGGGGGLSTVMEAANSMVEFAGTLFNTIIGNQVLVIFVGASFVGIGLGIVKKLKSTARS